MKRKFADVILLNSNSNPVIKSRSSSALSTSSELFISLLGTVRKSLDNIEQSFHELSVVITGIDSQSKGYVLSIIFILMFILIFIFMFILVFI